MRVIPLFCRVSYDGQSFLLMLQVSFPLQLVLTKYCAILKSAEIKAVIEEKAFFWKFSAWIFYVPPTDWLMWRLRINLRILVIAPDCEKSSHKKRKKMEAPRCCVSEIIEQGKWREGWRAEITQAFFFFQKWHHSTSPVLLFWKHLSKILKAPCKNPPLPPLSLFFTP